MRKKCTLELFTMWLFAVFAAAGLILVNMTYPSSEKGYPTLIFGMMLLFSVICLVQYHRNHTPARKAGAVEAQSDDDKPTAEADTSGMFNTAVVIAASIAYLLLMNILGFLVDTLLLTILLPPILGYKKPLPIILTSICCITFIYFLFTRLYIPIPSCKLPIFR